MKESILGVLKGHKKEGFVSGEELSRQFQVSRTAIWKHIRALKEEGYEIESIPRCGYKLVAVPDMLYPQEIKPLLTTEIIGTKIHHFEEVTSTNDVIKQLADKGAPEGTIVVCEEQLAGKGRLGRTWFSPRGAGVWCSVLLRPSIMPQHASKLTLLGAVAVAQGIRNQCGITSGIKWPNDLLFQGKKVCGLLTEMRAELDSVEYVVIGFGINVKNIGFPEDVSCKAISLEQMVGGEISRKELLAEILASIESNYLLFLEQGFTPIKEQWEQFNITLGNKVVLSSPGQRVTGTAVRLGDEGQLVIKSVKGEERAYYAGEVTLRT